VWPACTGGKSVGILPRSERYYVQLIASGEAATGTCRILPTSTSRDPFEPTGAHTTVREIASNRRYGSLRMEAGGLQGEAPKYAHPQP
jgi:hypothetical protein